MNLIASKFTTIQTKVIVVTVAVFKKIRYHYFSAIVNQIIRIEFSPVVEISSSNGQGLFQETTYVGLALSNV